MTRLNSYALSTLESHGVTESEWAALCGLDEWRGDRCGCTDDRCIGFHHDGDDDCLCLAALLDIAIANRNTSGA